MNPENLLLVVHAAVTWAMTGLIWFVQVVHYPLFGAVGAAGFGAYHAGHTARTTLVVAPLMLLEAGCALWIAAMRPTAWGWLGAGLLAAVWLATFAVAVPRHAVLAAGFDHGSIEELVAANWIRTAAWTARAVLAGWMLLSAATLWR